MKRGLYPAGALLLVSMGTTFALMALEGEWVQAIPLHLCSVSALFALALAFGAKSGVLLDFLWYLGVPGAALALLFPAPAASRLQPLLNASYVITHALIIAVTLLCIRRGARPARDGGARAMMLLQGAALCAFGVNRLLGTDFMFLSAPPAGTPLEIPFGWGYGAYIASLELVMLGVCLLMGALMRAAQRISPPRFDG